MFNWPFSFLAENALIYPGTVIALFLMAFEKLLYSYPLKVTLGSSAVSGFADGNIIVADAILTSVWFP